MARIAIIHLSDHTADDIRDANLPPGHTLVGLFDYPRRIELKCTGTCVRKGSGAWSRDPRGFIKCSVCGSRNRKMRSWLIGHLFDLLGANLINDSAPAAFKTPEGYGPRDH
jgi:hypothetical protein